MGDQRRALPISTGAARATAKNESPEGEGAVLCSTTSGSTVLKRSRRRQRDAMTDSNDDTKRRTQSSPPLPSASYDVPCHHPSPHVADCRGRLGIATAAARLRWQTCRRLPATRRIRSRRRVATASRALMTWAYAGGRRASTRPEGFYRAYENDRPEESRPRVEGRVPSTQARPVGRPIWVGMLWRVPADGFLAQWMTCPIPMMDPSMAAARRCSTQSSRRSKSAT